MATVSWKPLLQILEAIKGSEPLLRGSMQSLADRLENATAAYERNQLDEACRELSAAVSEALRLAPAETKQAAQGSDVGTATAATYVLGQLVFAQVFASRAAEKRADDRFVSALSDPRFAKYVHALLRSAQTGKNLARISGETPETVSRKLNHLRDLGIVDGRREGVSVYNFLTPAARAAAEKLEHGERPYKPIYVNEVKLSETRTRMVSMLLQQTSIEYRAPPILCVPAGA